MKYFVIAGERSGDLHGSYLVREIFKKDPKAEIIGYGGDLMERQGMRLLSHYQEGAFMGFLEVLINLRSILSRIKRCKSGLVAFNPDIVIFIDYPGFNLRMAAFAKKLGFKTCYYISPKIWAWKKGRIKQIRKFVDRMLVIFPFEVPFYKELAYPVTYVGNPLVEQVDGYVQKTLDTVSSSEQIEYRIAFMPGSRKQEVKASIPRILELADQQPTWQILVTAVDNLPASDYQELNGKHNIELVTNQTYDVLLTADAAVVTSGTATLEAALLGVPQVVCYEANPVSYAIGKRLVTIKYISLVNLIADEEIVKELIQSDYTAETVLAELRKLLLDKEYVGQLKANYQRIRTILQNKKASEEASKIIVKEMVS